MSETELQVAAEKPGVPIVLARSGRLVGLDLLKLLLAVAVVVQHMTSEARYTEDVNDFIVALASWVDGAVAGFFMISGFLLSPKVNTGFLAFVRRSAFRLLLPYLLFSLIYAFAMAGLGKAGVVDGLVDTILLRGAGPQLYFLPYLFCMQVAAWPLLAIRQRAAVTLTIAAAMFVVATLLPTAISTGHDVKLVPLFLGCFALGVGFRALRDRDLAVATMVAVAACAAAIPFDHRAIDVLLVVVLFYCALRLSATGLLDRLVIFGSGAIYILHTPVLNHTVSTTLQRAGIEGYFNLAASVTITVAVCLGAAFIVLRWFPRARGLLLE